VEDFARLSHRILDAIVHRDAVTLDAVFDDELVAVAPAGGRQRKHEFMLIHLAATIALIIAGASVCAAVAHRSVEESNMSDLIDASKRMPDGKQWMTDNLSVPIDQSYCYGDTEANCRRYGRLYTWESARRGCQSLGDGWRLPTDDEWRQLAKHHGGAFEEKGPNGKAAYSALQIGGGSGFNALLGGNRESDKSQYSRLEAHGFYWTASEAGPTSAVFYNFGKGSQALYRQGGGNKQMAISVRCVRD
jgi:uncharacterized protein (TIGR02145 family)